MKNIFIEGLQGSGKTTLQRQLGQRLPEYHIFMEGDISPVELAWCSYMTEAEYEQALAAFPDLKEEIETHSQKEGDYFITGYTRILAEKREFYQYMERYEIYNGRRSFDEFKEIVLRRFKNFEGTGNIFECSFFQNIIENLMLFYQKTQEEILDFYRELYAVVEKKDFALIYLYSENIENDILQIKKERSDKNGTEMWFPLMMNYLNDSPYGKKHTFKNASDMASYFARRRKLEVKIINEILGGQAVIVPAKAYRIEEIGGRLGGF